MRSILTAILFLLCIESTAQAPPVIQWQKAVGGSQNDAPAVIKATSDGGYIIAGYTDSDDGDITGQRDSSDLLVIKLGNTGNIEWQRCYGGYGNEQATDMLLTPDGGYILTGISSSVDGDVTGNHGRSDIWVIKINSTGNLLWQKSYGSSANDGHPFTKICPAISGGYIIMSQARGGDGDVTGYHTASISTEEGDIWVFKIDIAGNLLWQKCLGGSKTDSPGALIPTTDGGYIIAGLSHSANGDITCSNNTTGFFWMAKLNDAGVLLWQQCQSASSNPLDGKQTSDGGFIFTGTSSGVANILSDLHILKTDAAGIMQWERKYGGSEFEAGQSIFITNDGGCVIAGYTASEDIFVCDTKGSYDTWLIKLDNTGNLEWQKTYGGSQPDEFRSVIQTPDLGFAVTGRTLSDDGDISGQHGHFDIWLVKLSFPGIEVLPTINISADETDICPGKIVTFIAECTEEGDLPLYQWQVNGLNAGTNNDTLVMSTLANGDIITCTLTSSSACVTRRIVVSNSITITVDPSKTPANFLPADTATVCEYGTLELKPVGNFKTYLWSNGATTPALIVSEPGTYLVQVTTNEDCPGIDSVVVFQKECLLGFYMPTGFTPNSDGKNDILKPFIGGRIVQYRLMILNRWGQVVFQSTDPGKGWDGTFNGIKQSNDVFVWSCTYQFAGEELKSEKGTVVIVR